MEQESIEKKPNGFWASLNNKQLLRIEKTLFVIAVAIAEFYVCIKFGGLKWITDETILLYIAPPFAILALWLRRYRKNKFPKNPPQTTVK